MTRKYKGLWPQAMKDTLMKLWAEGRSASAIGEIMCISKGSVIGAAHRLGCEPRPSPFRLHHARQGNMPGRISANVGLPPTPIEPWKTVHLDAKSHNHGRKQGVFDHRKNEASWSNISSTIAQKAAADQRTIDDVTPSHAATFKPSLPRTACCWPMWADNQKPTHVFCGDPSVPGRPYCDHHHKIAFVPGRTSGGKPFVLGW